jgi:membrane associated rhomboid family serine protease
MGVYDRDYIRSSPRPGGPGGSYGGGFGLRAMRMWSVTTWLIVICIGIFALDRIIPPTRSIDPLEAVYAVDADRVSPAARPEGQLQQEPTVIPDPRTGQPVQVVRYFRVIEDPATSQIIGKQYYRVEMRPTLEYWGHFSTARGFMQLEVWRLVTFQFLHANFEHILFNMIGLFFFGPIVERYLGSRRYLAFYLMCGIAGALLYLILNFVGGVMGLKLPLVLINSPWTPLVGASAGIYGILAAAAYVSPHAVVQLLFPPIPMRLRTMAYGLIGIAFLTLLFQGNNAGGHAGHIGGAIAGYYLIRRPALLRDFLNFRGAPQPSRYQGDWRRDPAPAKPKKGGSRFGGRKGGKADDARIDAILGKVATHGLASLTEAEKKLLRQASESMKD